MDVIREAPHAPRVNVNYGPVSFPAPNYRLSGGKKLAVLSQA